MTITKLRLQAPKYWWKKEFGEKYYTTYYPQLTPERTLKEVEFIKKAVPLRLSQNILDLGCGHGRHTIGLARQHFNITGLDYSDYLLNIARKEADKMGIRVNFIKKDMRYLDVQNMYDVILSMFSTFGYFPHKENLYVLRHVFEALKPGGKFLIDIMNSYALISETYRKGRNLNNGTHEYVHSYRFGKYAIKDTCTYIEKPQLYRMHRTWRMNNKKGSFDLYMIEYRLEQYKHMLESIGFQIENLWGDYDGGKWKKDRWRTIILCQKPRNKISVCGPVSRFVNFTIKRRWPTHINNV